MQSRKNTTFCEGLHGNNDQESFEHGHDRFFSVCRFRFPSRILGDDRLYVSIHRGLHGCAPCTFQPECIVIDSPDFKQPASQSLLCKLEIFLNTLAIAGSFTISDTPDLVFAPYGHLLEHHVRARTLVDDLHKLGCGEDVIIKRVTKAVCDIQQAWWSRLQNKELEALTLGQIMEDTRPHADTCWQFAASGAAPRSFLESWEIERRQREERLLGSEAGLREAKADDTFADADGLQANSYEFVCNGQPDASGSTLYVPEAVLSSRASRMLGPDRIIFVKGGQRNSSHFQFLGRRWKVLYWTLEHVAYFAEEGFGLETVLCEKAMNLLVPLHLNKSMTYLKLNQRLHLSFSKSRCTPDVHVNEADDFQDATGMYCLSEGCGSISLNLARRIADELGLPQVPSAFQARCLCFKGLWLVDTAVPIGVLVRPSQKKYLVEDTGNNAIDFEVVRHSQADCQATLNRDFIQALEHLGVPSTVFKELQDEVLKFLSDKFSSDDALDFFLSECPWKSPVDKVLGLYLDSGMAWNEPSFARLRYRCMKYYRKQITEDLKLPLQNCVRVWMVPDITRTLQPGECFLQLSTWDSHRLAACDVVVLRSPCYHPARVRKLRVVRDVPDVFRHYADVLLLSAHPDCCGPGDAERMEGDCDGDQVLVVWDERIVKAVVPVEPSIGLGASETSSMALETIEKTVQEHAVKLPEKLLQCRTMVLKEHKEFKEADKLRRAWADKVGFENENVCKLARLCSVGVDCAATGSRIQIPQELKKQWPCPNWATASRPDSYQSQKACGILYESRWEIPDVPDAELLTYQQLQVQRWTFQQHLDARMICLEWLDELQRKLGGIRCRPISFRLKRDTESALFASFHERDLPPHIPKSLLGTVAYMRCVELWASNDRSPHYLVAKKAASDLGCSTSSAIQPSHPDNVLQVEGDGRSHRNLNSSSNGKAEQACESDIEDKDEYTPPALLLRLFEANICLTVAEATHGICPQLVGDKFLVDPCNINFTQAEISQSFRSGEPIACCLEKMLAGVLRKRDLPMIRVRWYHGKFFSLDNRRLALFRLFKMHAPCGRCTRVKILRISDDEARQRRWRRKFTTSVEVMGSSVAVQPTRQVIGCTMEDTSFAL